MCGRTAWLRARRGEKPAALVGLCNRRGRRGNLSLAGIAGARSGTGHEFRLDDRIMRRAGPGGAGMRMAAVETHPFFVTQTFTITRDWLLGTNHWGGRVRHFDDRREEESQRCKGCCLILPPVS